MYSILYTNHYFSWFGLLIVVQQPVDAITLPGETVLLQCVFFDDRRSLLVSSEWYRNGESTVGLQRHSEFHNPGTTITIGLLIENVMRADDGAVYHCSPVGRPDITSKLVSITVAGTALNGSIYIIFQACIELKKPFSCSTSPPLNGPLH